MKVADAVQQSDDESMDEFGFEYDYDEDAVEEQMETSERVNPLPPMDKFGWFYERNGTAWSDGILTMHTGKKDLSKLGKIAGWESLIPSKAFPSPCGDLIGSSDGLFPPRSDSANRSSLSLFSTDLCRPLHFTRNEDINRTEILDSFIPVETYSLDASNFANSTDCPKNSCYNNNLPSGVQNVTQCKGNSPVFVSRPHFYLADPFYRNQFQQGIEPTQGFYDSFFRIEPSSSIPVEVKMKLQLNVFLRKVKGIEYLFKEVPDLMFPVFWFETEITMEEQMLRSLQMLLITPKIIQASGISSLTTSFCIILGIIFCGFKQSQRKKVNNRIKTAHESCEYSKVSSSSQNR